MAGEKLGDLKPEREISCPACRAPVAIRVPSQTVVVACSRCKTICDVTQDAPKAAGVSRDVSNPVIPMGRRGTLRGSNWAVIGMLVRMDESGQYWWQEYLLYNPVDGFRWLVQNNGHWSFVKTTRNSPKHVGYDVEFLGSKYRRFLVGHAVVAGVYGEINWKVGVGEKVKVADYINPPNMLSMEKSAGETIWSLGEYVEADEVKEAFAITDPLPSKVGIAPNQPNSGAGRANDLLKAWVVFVVVAIAIAFTIGVDGEKVVLQQEFTAVPGTAEYKSDEFEIDIGPRVAAVRMWSQIENNWVEVSGDLVDVTKGDERPFNIGNEYYSGVEDGERWVEANNDQATKLSSVPKGRYRLEFEVQYGSPPDRPFTLQVTEGKTAPSNFFLIAFLLSVLPVSLGYLSHRKEATRWSESDFSPYVSDDDDEEEEES